ncbi:MAG: hypothetical protein [Bacteriophage sp.]|nr:MAG: hypothetical protein [Bacteriophage sp.]
MDSKNRGAIMATSLICGYAATVLQITDGPAKLCLNLRLKLMDVFVSGKLRNHDKLKNTLSDLVDCGWCLSPYLTLIGYPLVRKALHAPKQGLPESLAGFATATALTAFLRHFADTY